MHAFETDCKWGCLMRASGADSIKGDKRNEVDLNWIEGSEHFVQIYRIVR